MKQIIQSIQYFRTEGVIELKIYDGTDDTILYHRIKGYFEDIRLDVLLQDLKKLGHNCELSKKCLFKI